MINRQQKRLSKTEALNNERNAKTEKQQLS